MHPLVRDLYKRVLHVGQDYPTGLEHVKQVWKQALRNPRNCPSCYNEKGEALVSSTIATTTTATSPKCQEELLQAVNQGRLMVKEMIGVIQLKKYRTIKSRYGNENQNDDANNSETRLQQAVDQMRLANSDTISHTKRK